MQREKVSSTWVSSSSSSSSNSYGFFVSGAILSTMFVPFCWKWRDGRVRAERRCSHLTSQYEQSLFHSQINAQTPTNSARDNALHSILSYNFFFLLASRFHQGERQQLNWYEFFFFLIQFVIKTFASYFLVVVVFFFFLFFSLPPLVGRCSHCYFAADFNFSWAFACHFFHTLSSRLFCCSQQWVMTPRLTIIIITWMISTVLSSVVFSIMRQ